jgi:hypothetical protein
MKRICYGLLLTGLLLLPVFGSGSEETDSSPENRLSTGNQETSSPAIWKRVNDIDGELIVATVDEEPIHFREIKKAFRNTLKHHRELFPEQALDYNRVMTYFRELVNKRVQHVLIRREIEKRDAFPTAEKVEKEVARFREVNKMQGEEAYRRYLDFHGLTREEVEQQIRFNVGVYNLASYLDEEVEPPTEEELEALYENNREWCTEPEMANFSIIVIQHAGSDDPAIRNKNLETMQTIREGIVSGKHDFEYYARNFSDDKISRNKGGELGLLPLEVVYQRYSFLENMDIKELSPVLDHPDYAMLVQRNEYVPEKRLPFEEVKESLKKRALKTMKEHRRREYYRELYDNAQIEIDEEEMMEALEITPGTPTG